MGVIFFYSKQLRHADKINGFYGLLREMSTAVRRRNSRLSTDYSQCFIIMPGYARFRLFPSKQVLVGAPQCSLFDRLFAMLHNHAGFCSVPPFSQQAGACGGPVMFVCRLFTTRLFVEVNLFLAEVLFYRCVAVGVEHFFEGFSF